MPASRATPPTSGTPASGGAPITGTPGSGSVRITAERKKHALDDANRSGGYARTLQWLGYAAAVVFLFGVSQLGGGRSRLQVITQEWGAVLATAGMLVALASDRLGSRAWAPGIRVQERVNWFSVVLGGALFAVLVTLLVQATTDNESRLLVGAVLVGAFVVGLALWLMLVESASLRALRRESSRHRRY